LQKNPTIRFALIGAGHIGRRHAQQMARCGQLIAIADPVTEKANRLAAELGSRAYPSLKAVLADEIPDVVAICTPNYLHAIQSMEALQAGCHVLCEKPMCLHREEADGMIRAAREAGKHLFVVKQNRFNPPVQLVQELIREGRMGKIHSFQINAVWNRPVSYYDESDWHGKKDRDGGILFTQFSHFIDLLCWLLGDVEEVRTFRDNFGRKESVDGEDTGVAVLRMKSGAIGSLYYTVGAYDKNMEGSFTLLGERGTIKIGGQYLNHLEYFCVEGMESPTLPTARPANEYGFYQGSMSNHDKVYDELMKALRQEPFDLASAREAADTVSLIEKILR
jgi:UDP-N-acetyl-2-amino-2-deoxyglucuronate dehydrogenase